MRRPQLLVALWAAAMILFNFPMLIVFDRDVTVLGLPLLPVALFASWGLLIVALALVLERGGPPPERPEAAGKPGDDGAAIPDAPSELP